MIVSQAGLPLRRRQRARSIVSACGRVYVSFGSSKCIDPARRSDPISIVTAMLTGKGSKSTKKYPGKEKEELARLSKLGICSLK